MESETLLKVLDSQKIENDSKGSGNLEYRDESAIVPEERNENDQVDENEDEDDDSTGVVN